MIRVTVDGQSVSTKSGTSKAGKPYTIHEQEVYAHLVDPDTGKPKKYPTPITVTVEAPEKPYPDGDYLLSPRSVKTDQYGRLEFARVALEPVAVQSAQPRKAVA